MVIIVAAEDDGDTEEDAALFNTDCGVVFEVDAFVFDELFAFDVEVEAVG